MSNKLPFTIVKRSGTTLVRQIVDGFRRAIDFGFYRPGDMLPSLREVSKETGVSLIVVREAFRRIAAEGYASLRRGIGSIVLDQGAFAWRGHIVIASVEIRENHLISAMTGALRKSLMEAGYMVSTVPFGSEPSTYDFSQLDSVLRTPVTLVVATSATPAIDRHLATQSALHALLESGIDIPGDVKLVTWSNAGEGPFWRKSLTRIEVDPIESGRVFADYVLAYLTGKKIKQRVVISPKYIIGDTFPAS